MSIVIAIALNGGRGLMPGKMNPLLPRPAIWSANRRNAASDNGTWCSRCIFIREPGTTHVLEAKLTSSNVICKTSLVLAQVKTVNCNARDAVVCRNVHHRNFSAAQAGVDVV
jgi:hypothetical protein